MLRLINYGLMAIAAAGVVVQGMQFTAFKILVLCALSFYGVYVLGIALSLRQSKWQLTPVQAKHLAIAITIGILLVTGAITEAARTSPPTSPPAYVPQNRLTANH